MMTFLLFSCQKDNLEESMYAILISKNGVLVSESYQNDTSKDTYSNIQSLTKGIMSILIGIAIDEGLISDEDQRIDQYLPEIFEKIVNQDKRKITIKHLLNQTSGLQWKGYLEHQSWQSSDNPLAFVINKELVHPPGSHYNYNSGATHLLSAIITKVSGSSTLEFAKNKLFDKLGIKEVRWEKLKDGHYDGGGLGLSMRAVDLMKIGQMLELGGQVKHERLVSESWVDKLFSIDYKSSTRWGIRKSKHGYCWYQAELENEVINYGMGYGGQFIILVPAQQLIIVATQNHDTADGLQNQNAFLRKKLPELIRQYQ